MKVSVIVVHYHAPRMTGAAVEAFRAQAAEVGVDLEVLVVDNGSSDAEWPILQALPGRILRPGENLGYAGGVNAGVGEASGEVFLLANPDLVPFAGALGALLASLAGGAGVAGPQFFWDQERRFLLPPNERRDRRSDLASGLAGRGDGWARRARRRYRRHARRHWSAREEVVSRHLSGALLAVRRDAWHRVGPFDHGYPLYFEEVDWLRRCAAAGVRSVFQPRAEVLHHFDRSASLEARAAEWFATSERRFRQRWYGPLYRALHRRVARGPIRLRPAPVLAAGPPRWPREGWLPAMTENHSAGPWWMELSPRSHGFPAAAERWGAAEEGPPLGPWTLPEALWSRLRPGRWRLALTDGAGIERAVVTFEAPHPEGTGPAGDRGPEEAAPGSPDGEGQG